MLNSEQQTTDFQVEWSETKKIPVLELIWKQNNFVFIPSLQLPCYVTLVKLQLFLMGEGLVFYEVRGVILKFAWQMI